MDGESADFFVRAVQMAICFLGENVWFLSEGGQNFTVSS